MSDITYKILEDGRLLLAVPPDRKPELVTLLNRALNCFPEAAAEWKHLADLLQHGAPLVDYYAQEASTKMRHTEPKEKPDNLANVTGYPHDLKI